MKTPRMFHSVAGLSLLLTLGACAPPQDAGSAVQTPAPVPAANDIAPEQSSPPPAPIVCNSCGVVRSITAVSQAGEGTGVGAVIGAIVGGVAGNQIGGGSGKKIATVAGVIGGAVVGNKVEQNRNDVSYYEVVIDMEGGGQQFITVADASGISPGAQVNVQGSTITLR